jgi:uncharacterized phage protein (TIGR02218 family)
MKSITYETSAGATVALLATREAMFATLIQFSLLNGAGSLYYTSSDWPLKFNGNTYQTAMNSGVVIDRKGSKAKIKWNIGTHVNTLAIDVLANNAKVNGQDFFAAVKQGVFDGATVTFYRAYWNRTTSFMNPILPVGVVQMFAGHVAQIDSSRSKVTFTIKDYMDLLNIQLPRNLYQGGCLNTLYDTACTLNANSFMETGGVTSGSSASVVNNTTLTGTTGVYDQGKITFTSGLNNGISRSVKQYINGSPTTIALLSPFPNTPANGDTFKVFQGCNKTQSTCNTKFSNLINFRGFPYIPENSTAV